MPPATADEFLVVKARLSQLLGVPRPLPYISITGYDESASAWDEGLFAITLQQGVLLIAALRDLLVVAVGGEAIQR